MLVSEMHTGIGENERIVVKRKRFIGSGVQIPGRFP